MGILKKILQFLRCLLIRLQRKARRLLRLKAPTLEDRFIAFCKTYPRGEPIDQIALTQQQEALRQASNLKRADFFFDRRAFVCEIKTLKIETSGKLVAIMQKVGLDPATLPEGTHILEQLFQKLPEGSKLLRNALKIVMTPLINDFNQAVKQIRDTKTLFNLPNADGVLIILNDTVTIGGQPLVYKRLKQRLLKKDGTDAPFHADLNQVLYVGETHVVETASGDMAVSVTLSNPHSLGNHRAEAFVFRLVEAWAAYNCIPFSRGGTEIEQVLENSQLYVDVKPPS
jgi:hypothetical protein